MAVAVGGAENRAGRCRPGPGPIECELRSAGVSVALALDWDVRRLMPGFADRRAVDARLARAGRNGAAALEYGHGDGSACLHRAKFGVVNYGIGDRRLLLTVEIAAELCLQTAFPQADPDVVRLAARAVAGEVLAPPFDEPCPRWWDGDGLDLLAHVVECLSERPELVVPCDGYWASPNRDGTVSHLRLPDGARGLIDWLLAGPRPPIGDFEAAVLDYVRPRLAATSRVTVADFREAPAAVMSAPADLAVVQDVRALAFAPDEVAFAALSAASRRLAPKDGVLLTDAACRSHTWAFRAELLLALARDGFYSGVSWWAVVDGEARPVGAVAARDWEDPPADVAAVGMRLTPVDPELGIGCA